MSKQVPKRSNIFLMELILTILFFALAAAVCMQFFAGAKALSDKTQATNKGLIVAKNIESIFTGADDPLGAINAAYPAAVVSDSSVTLTYDRDFNETAAENAVYTITAAWQPRADNPQLWEGTVEISGKDLAISLPLSRYQTQVAAAPQAAPEGSP